MNGAKISVKSLYYLIPAYPIIYLFNEVRCGARGTEEHQRKPPSDVWPLDNVLVLELCSSVVP